MVMVNATASRFMSKTLIPNCKKVARVRLYLRIFNHFVSESEQLAQAAKYSVLNVSLSGADIDTKKGTNKRQHSSIYTSRVSYTHGEGVVPLESDTTYDSPEEGSPSCGKDYEVGRVSTFL